MREKISPLRVTDPRNYKKFSGLEINTVYRWDDKVWRCTTKDEHLRIGVNLGLVVMSRAERELDLQKNLCPVLAVNKIRKITFEEIADKMEWKYNEDNTWLG